MPNPKWKNNEYYVAAAQTDVQAKAAEFATDGRPRAWDVAMAGLEDVRCRFREDHVFNLFHALGISPDAPWPPMELALDDLPTTEEDA